MADNLQTKTEKLIKYGNEKFGLNETTLRGILDNASGSEDLTTELDTQDGLLTNLEAEINGLPLSSTELTASTDEEMEALLIQENIGKVVKFTGTSDIYETDSYYLIGE